MLSDSADGAPRLGGRVGPAPLQQQRCRLSDGRIRTARVERHGARGERYTCGHCRVAVRRTCALAIWPKLVAEHPVDQQCCGGRSALRSRGAGSVLQASGGGGAVDRGTGAQ